MYVHMYTCTHLCMYYINYINFMYVRMYVHVCSPYNYVCMSTLVCTCMYICTYIHTYTYSYCSLWYVHWPPYLVQQMKVYFLLLFIGKNLFSIEEV